ncbi:LLM class flavin-dependent oxidoreductase [Nakamurella lactea]|uniref:LLM class flavin-dependent oxidoreductase n=1 Tax=Nakamurella lactea TaxID=459515 RepID=UPI000422516D|nr:LLM class flavin-dependent oxidoreductase [Nakamurella lactea]
MAFTTEEIFSKLRVYLFPWGANEPDVASMIKFVKAAEDLGFDAVHVPWHFTMPKTKSFAEFGTRYLFDPMVLMPILARETSRIKIAFEFVVPALHPFVWAQYFASLDNASNGRALAVPVLGWWDEDYSVGMVDSKRRGKRMDEALDVMTKLWAGEAVESDGIWESAGLELNPRPVQQPFPMWIGGGEKSLDRSARFAEAFYPLFPTEQEVRDEMIPTLAAKSEKFGREKRLELAVVNYGMISEDEQWIKDWAIPRLIARTNGMTLDQALEKKDDPSIARPEERLMIGRPQDAAKRLAGLLDAGVDHLVMDFYLHGWEDSEFGLEHMTRFAKEVVPLAAQP